MVELPRYVIAKMLSTSATSFYFNVPVSYRKRGCPIHNEPLGADYSAMVSRALTLNGLVDEWLHQPRTACHRRSRPRIGTVDWMFREYKASKAYTEKVSKVSRSSYEKIMRMVCDTLTKKVTASERDRSDQLRHAAQTSSMTSLFRERRGSGRDKRRRPSASAARS